MNNNLNALRRVFCSLTIPVYFIERKLQQVWPLTMNEVNTTTVFYKNMNCTFLTNTTLFLKCNLHRNHSVKCELFQVIMHYLRLY